MKTEKDYFYHYNAFVHIHNLRYFSEKVLMHYSNTKTFIKVCIFNIITCICVRVFFRNVDEYM